MSVLGWMSAIGGLLLFMALTSSHVRRLPISTSFIYLLAGIALGPLGFDLVHVDIAAQSRAMEVLTEIAVIVSLFVGGLKLRLPLRHVSWKPAILLASGVMLLSIAGVALVANQFLALTLFPSLLLGAMLAPTDPVLASAVSVNDAGDHDRVRFALSGEAGLNDGAAFPFVVFALSGMREGALGAWVGSWFASRILWAVPAGLAVGYGMGLLMGRFAIRLRSRQRDSGAPSDFLALALIALAYVAAERVHAWGFLSVFAAGVGLRHAEVRIVHEHPNPSVRTRLGSDVRHRVTHRMRRWVQRGEAGAQTISKRPLSDPVASGSTPTAVEAIAHPPAEMLVGRDESGERLEQPAVAAGVLIAEALTFGDTLERLLEVLLIVLVGIAVAQAWAPRAVTLALVTFLFVRPISVFLMMRGSDLSPAQRGLLGWFGIRGIGSLYYLCYALNHGLGGDNAAMLVKVVVTVIACSIIVHGISVTPIVAHYERSLKSREAAA